MPGEGLLLANIIDYVRGADGVLMLSSMNAADALALAICHARFSASLMNLGGNATCSTI